jgi:hypothetical protein
MVTATGVHLLPSTGEYTYDTIPFIAAQHSWTTGLLFGAEPINTYFAPGGAKTDYSYAIDQLQATHPECRTVSVVVSWFFNSEDAAACDIYPSTNFLLGEIWQVESGVPVETHWMVSGLTEQDFPGVIPLPTTSSGSYVYGGTPSDPSIVRCIRDLKARGFRVVFYPFLLGTCAGYPWRGRITFSLDNSSAATAAVGAFLGRAEVGDFVQDPVNLTVGYLGSKFDWTYRRMILHYANLCCVAGGVNLFVIGSELRGLETIRGPAWTAAGTTDSSGNAVWDYPFVAGLVTLANDVRSVFDRAGLTKSLATLESLVTYSADWSSWMGWQHPGANGQWPHLDSLWASSNIDLVSFDNYLPLSDWTTGTGGIDATENWSRPAPSGSWPPSSATMSGLGLSGVPTIYSSAYLKANIEGGQYYNWFYNDGNSGGMGLDPNGSGLQVSLCEGDRLAQARNAYSADQQILANKQLRWWWNNRHYAIYETTGGWDPQGPQTQWAPRSKSIVMLEYGFSAVDKATNQPNVFFDVKSTESASPYWSIWNNAGGLGYLPQRDDTIAALALQAIYDYWNTDGNNAASSAGLPMLNWAFACVWNWDARPWPIFPLDSSAWGDAGNWAAGDWTMGLRTSLVPSAPSPPPTVGTFAIFPSLSTLGWSMLITPRFSTGIAGHVSGRESRAIGRAAPLFDIELSYAVLRTAAAYEELQTIAGFFESIGGADTPFWFAPPGLSAVTGQAIGTGDGSTTTFSLQASIGAFTGPVSGTSGVSAVYLDRVAQVTGSGPGIGWSVSSGYAPAITFAAAPAAGVAISADFGVLWLCRFADDVLEFEQFVAQLFALKTLKLQTVRP